MISPADLFYAFQEWFYAVLGPVVFWALIGMVVFAVVLGAILLTRFVWPKN